MTVKLPIYSGNDQVRPLEVGGCRVNGGALNTRTRSKPKTRLLQLYNLYLRFTRPRYQAEYLCSAFRISEYLVG